MKSTFLAINITTFYRMTINSKIINCLNFHRSFYFLFVSTSIFVKNCHFTRVPLNMKKLQKLSSNWCCWILRYTRSVEKTLFDVRFNWVISFYWYVIPRYLFFVAAKRSPSPKSRSRSTPPVRSQRPQTNSVISAVRQPTMPVVIPPPEPKVRILCLKLSLNPLRFSLMRETDTKVTRAKSWAICKTSILEWQN